MLKQALERNPVVIGPALPGDSAAIVASIHRAFTPYRGMLQPEPSALAETVQRIEAAMVTGTVLVARRHGRIAGCVSVQQRGDSAYAGRLSVEPDARGIGIGRALMAEAEMLARHMGAVRLRVDVRLALMRNRAFFRALGFVEGARRRHPGFASPTYVEMEKTLI